MSLRLSLRLGLHLYLSLLEHQWLPLDPLPHVEDVVDDSLEMRCGVVGFGDEDVFGGTRRSGGVKWSNGDESRVMSASTLRLLRADQ